jgi:hypothetical protein
MFPVIVWRIFGLLVGLWPFAIVVIFVTGQASTHAPGGCGGAVDVGVGVAVGVEVGVGEYVGVAVGVGCA